MIGRRVANIIKRFASNGDDGRLIERQLLGGATVGKDVQCRIVRFIQ
jgi:hypothetical protein